MNKQTKPRSNEAVPVATRKGKRAPKLPDKLSNCTFDYETTQVLGRGNRLPTDQSSTSASGSSEQADEQGNTNLYAKVQP